MYHNHCSDGEPSELLAMKEISTCPICLDLFDNARRLSCSHTFCLHCLRTFSNNVTYSNCPQCRSTTVPRTSDVDQVEINIFANELAKLICAHEAKAYSEKDDAEDTQDESGIYAGQLVPCSQLQPKRSSSYKFASTMLKSAFTIASLGVAGVYYGVQEYKRRKQLQKEQCLYPFASRYTCGSCLNVIKLYSEHTLRYKCGICEDFDLCPNCAMDNTGQVHRSDHILVKLKFRQKRTLPPGPLLRYRLVKDMCDDIDFSSNVHDRTIIHSPHLVCVTPGIACSVCDVFPITGVRYKCGMCEDYELCEDCEKHSETIHDPDHVFLVIKNRMRLNVTTQPLIRALVY